MSESNLLFLRQGEVIVGTKLTESQASVPIDGRSFQTRIQFEIEKTSESNANKAKVKLFNLSQDSRSFLEQKNLVIFVRAGYQGFTETLFVGDIVKPINSRQGPDLITELECGDGELTLTKSNINIGLGPNSTNIQALTLAITKLGLTVGTQKGLKTINYLNGFTYSGLAKTLIDQLVSQMGLEWHVQDTEIFILPKNEDAGNEAVVLSPNTGLIGYPTKTDDGMECVSLLNPKIKPGRAIKLESKQFSEGNRTSKIASQTLKNSGDIFKVKRCVYSGDTHEGPWQIKIEGVTVG